MNCLSFFIVSAFSSSALGSSLFGLWFFLFFQPASVLRLPSQLVPAQVVVGSEEEKLDTQRGQTEASDTLAGRPVFEQDAISSSRDRIKNDGLIHSERERQHTMPPRAVLTHPARVGQLSSGLSAADVVGLYGEPDGKTAKNDSETWAYGDSLVFFQGGSVTGWSDDGELEAREGTKQFQLEKSAPAISFREKGWENAWTPEIRPKLSDVIDSITDE